MIEFGVIHAVQRVQPTIHRTLASMHAAGIDEVAIFPDKGEHGATRNLIRALKSMPKRQDNHVCILDDDLLLCLHAKRLLLEAVMNWGERAAFTMWTIEQNLPHGRRDGHGWMHAEVGTHTWGGSVVLANTMVSNVVREMEKLLEEDPSWKTKPDATLFRALELRKIPVFHHLPSLVTHVGMGESTLGNTHSSNETAGYRWSEWG